MPDTTLPDPSTTPPDDLLPRPLDPSSLLAAVERVDADLAILTDDELEPINRDPLVVVTTVYGRFRRIEPFLPELATLTGFDLARVRALPDYAGALVHWCAAASYSTTPEPELGPLVERGLDLRRRTLGDLRALAGHGVFPRELVDRVGSSVGHTDLAHDLVALATFVDTHWSEIEGRSLLTRAAIPELSNAGSALMHALGDRRFAKARISHARSRRDRAYTRVVQVYAEARSGIVYLRRNDGDADAIAPLLHARVKKRKRAAREVEGGDESVIVMDGGPMNEGLGPRTTSLIVPDETSR